MAYALGEIGYDWPSEARREEFVQRGVADPDDAVQLLHYLDAHPESSAAVTWTLNREQVPIYAIQPGGPFARTTYRRLRRFLGEQGAGEIQGVAVPGWVSGSSRLRDGRDVPILWPEARGLHAWSIEDLTRAVLRRAPQSNKDWQKAEDVASFLSRVYYEVRNPGLAPPDRALNYAATQALEVERIFQPAIEAGLKLAAVTVDPSPLCRPTSDCWDVQLVFFNPSRRRNQARVVYRLTVDVSDVVPVTLGKVRHWEAF